MNDFENRARCHIVSALVMQDMQLNIRAYRKMSSKRLSYQLKKALSLVNKQWLSKPQIASAGSCCLVGIICNGLLHLANVGDSRVVLGQAERGTREVTTIQLSTEHHANMESVREELQSLHPHDSQIVVLKHKIWRVKGLIQVLDFFFFK